MNEMQHTTSLKNPRTRKTAMSQAIAIALATGSLSMTALAQQPQETKTLPKVNVEADAITPYKAKKASSPIYTQPLAETPKTITVVTEAVLQDQAVTSLRDALRNVSGITMQAGEGGAAAGDNLSIRGFDATNDLYVDGVRDIGAYSRDTFNLETVEVTKGPSSTASGRGSAGGSVNVVSKTAKFEDFKRGSLMVGNDSQLRAAIDVNSQLSNTVAGRLNVMTEDSGVPGRDVTERESSGIAGALTFKASEKTTLTAGLTWLDQDNLPDGGVPLLTDANGQRYLDEKTAENYYGVEGRDYDENEVLSLKLAVDHQFNDNLSLRNQTFIGQTETRAAFTRPSFNSDTGMVRRGGVKARDEDRDIISNQTTLRAMFASGNVKHDLVSGIDLTKEEYTRYELVTANDDPAEVDLYNPQTDAPYAGSISRGGGENSGQYDSIALFFSDTLTFTPQWSATVGVRAEQYDQEYSQNYTSSGRGGTLTPPFQYETDDTLVSWNASVSYKPAENGTIYFGLANAQTPLGSNLTLSADQQDIDAEEDELIELGTKWELFGDRLLATAAIFQSTKTNAQTTDENDLLVLDGEQEVSGFELGLNGAINDKWSLIANYSYTDTEITESGDPTEEGTDLFNIPEHSANLWSTYQLSQDWQVGGGLQYIGEYDNGTTTELDAVTLINAVASWQATDNLNLQLNVNNLTDEKYLLKPRGSRGVPGTGRSITLTASVEF